jgi:hypothetical protein
MLQKFRFFALFILFVHIQSIAFACTNEPTNFTFWLFMSHLRNNCGAIPYDYEHAIHLQEKEYYEQYKPIDTAHYVVNVQEWEKYLRKKVAAKDIHLLLYKTSANEYRYDDNGFLKKNTFYNFLQKPENKEIKSYIDFAKACEEVYNIPNLWSNESFISKGYEANKCAMMAQQGEQLYSNLKSDFLRLRTAFLLCKLYSYSKNKPALTNNYEQKMLKSSVQSWVKYSALFYLLDDENDTPQEIAYAFEAFKNSVDRRNLNPFQGVWGDKLGEQKVWAALTPHLKNNKDKAAAWAAQTYYVREPTLEKLQKIHQFDAKNKDLPILIYREIRKIENWVMSAQLTNYTYYDYTENSAAVDDISDVPDSLIEKNPTYYQRLWLKKDKAYLKKFSTWLQKVAIEGRSAEPTLINLSVAYLYFLEGNYSKSNLVLSKIKSNDLKDKELRFNYKMISLLNQIFVQPSANVTAKQNIAELFDFLQKEKNNVARFRDVKGQLELLLGNWLMTKNHLCEGALLIDKSSRDVGQYKDKWNVSRDFYTIMLEKATPREYDECFALLKKPSKNRSRFEEIILSTPRMFNCNKSDMYEESNNRWYNSNEVYNPIWDTYEPKTSNRYCYQFDTCRLLDFKGMYYFNRDELENAYAIWKKIPEEYYFLDTYKSNIHSPFANGLPFSKAAYVKGMIELKNEIASKKSANIGYDYMRLAKAYYETGIRGKSWYMREIYRSGGEKADISDKTNLFCYQKAKTYFEKAFENCKDEAVGKMLGRYITHCHKAEEEYAFFAKNPHKNWYDEDEIPVSTWSFSDKWKSKFPNGQDYGNYNCGTEDYFEHW